MQSELKPCPFCGGPAHSTPSVKSANFAAVIMCTENDCASVFGADLEIATKTWNRRAITAALSDKQAGEVKADRGDLLSLIKWAHETLYEINPSNYDHDEVCKLNDASVEVILGLAQALGEKHGYSADWWERYRTDHPLPALVDVPAAAPVAKQWCAYEDGQQHTSWYPDGYGDRAGWEALAKRNPAKYQVVTRDLFTSPPLSREGEDAKAEQYWSAVEQLANCEDEISRLRALLSRAEEYVIDGVTTAKGEAEMNAPYPARAPRYDAALAEVRQLYADIQAALAATRSGSATDHSGGDHA